MEHFKKGDEKYAKFSDLYGEAVDERDCPSTKPVLYAAEVDKKGRPTW